MGDFATMLAAGDVAVGTTGGFGWTSDACEAALAAAAELAAAEPAADGASSDATGDGRTDAC